MASFVPQSAGDYFGKLRIEELICYLTDEIRPLIRSYRRRQKLMSPYNWRGVAPLAMLSWAFSNERLHVNRTTGWGGDLA
jgi:hypothetical protein